MPTFQEITPAPLFVGAVDPAGKKVEVAPRLIDDYDPSRTYMDGALVRGPDGNIYSCIEPALAGDGIMGGGWGPVCVDPPTAATAVWEDSVRNPQEDLDDDAMQLARAFASRTSDSGGTLHGRVMDLLDDAYGMIEPLGGWGHI